MRTSDFESFKATLDEICTNRSTVLAPATLTQTPSVYVDPNRLRAEQAHIFDRSPLLAACSSELAEPNAYVARMLSGTPALIVRQDDGSIKAFLNSCRHRGLEVVWGEAAGCARHFVCRYHGWSYKADGTLIGVTTKVGFPGLDLSTHGLVELDCAERHGLIFVARTPNTAVDLDAFLGPFDAELDAMELGAFVVERRTEVKVEANWKLLVEGYLEGYHTRFLHKKTLTGLHSDRAETRVFGRHGRVTVIRTSYDPVKHTEPKDVLSQVVIAYRLFPNTIVFWAADHFELWQIEPDRTRPDHSLVRVAMLTRREALSRSEHWARNLKLTMDVLIAEDFAACESAQRAMSGGAAPPVIYYGRNEPGVQDFHRGLDAELAAAAVSTA